MPDVLGPHHARAELIHGTVWIVVCHVSENKGLPALAKSAAVTKQ